MYEWIDLNGRAASCIAWSVQIYLFIIICFSLNICGDDNNIFTHRKSFFQLLYIFSKHVCAYYDLMIVHDPYLSIY